LSQPSGSIKSSVRIGGLVLDGITSIISAENCRITYPTADFEFKGRPASDALGPVARHGAAQP